MANSIEAAFGKAIIHFDSSMFPTEGFMGIHDEPEVRVMRLRMNAEEMILVSADLVMIPDTVISKLQEIIGDKTGVEKEKIWIHVTHAITTPHEPGPMGPPDKRPPETAEDRRKKALYRESLVSAFEKVAEAISELKEARIGTGAAECDANCNRDKRYGDKWWTGLNPDGPSNKTMSVVRVDHADGKPMGFFISYGIKPCAIDNCRMKEGKRLVSADITGYCCHMLEEKYGVPALFGVSAAADQVPKEVAWIEIINEYGQQDLYETDVETGLGYVEKYGKVMGNTAIRIAEAVETKKESFEMKRSRISFEWGRRPGPGGSIPGITEAVSKEETPSMEITGELLSFGNIAFVAEKPEINCVTEKALLQTSPFANTFLLCMVNGGLKYMADAASYDRNTFEAQRSAPQKGAAERFVELVVNELNRMK